MELTGEELREIYRLLLLTRRNEEKVNEIYARRGLPELPHSCIGEEAVAVGSSYKLRREDYVLPSLRARGYFFVKGAPARVMLAGQYGKRTGPARGKSTSHHMGDLKLGILGGSGLIGSSIPLAVGAALAIKYQDRDNVVVTSFGDGATSRGDFHESMNLAAVWRLPVIFVCENNGYAIATRLEQQMAVKNVADRAAAYGMPGVIVDGSDVLAVFEATREAVERARSGAGPTLIECKTHRWRGHAENDPDLYRDRDVVESWHRDCPVKKYQDYLLSRGVLTEQMIDEIEASVRLEIEDAVRFAEESPFPEPEEALGGVYAE